MTPIINHTETRVGEAEGDPWRYVCPSCGSVSVVKRLEPDCTVSGSEAAAKYYCQGHKGPVSAVYDKKGGEEVKP